jgi:putative cell wall-binding protein
MTVRIAAVLCALALMLSLAPSALAHLEREGFWPEGDLPVPTYRTDGPALVVCKPDTAERLAAFPRADRERNEALLAQCEFEHIQDAIDAVTEQGSRILVMPGLYREEPNRELEGECAEEKADHDQVFTYEDHLRCPHAVSLIHILGQDSPAGEPDEHGSEELRCRNALCNLQIEGTGPSPLDVVIDGGYTEDGQWLKENGIRADRADGLYLANFTVQRFYHNAVYVLETDGYVFDRVVTRWNELYGFLNFMTDNGLYVDCEAHGSGDGGLYPGSQPEHKGEKFAAEVTGCKAHRNMVGLSGTAGNSLHVHDNDFYWNAAGWQTDSFVPNHPGMPTEFSVFENNRIWQNNMDYYGPYVHTGVCDEPPAERGHEQGVVCPPFPMAVGTGVMLPAGNDMTYRDNDVWDNWRSGFMQFWVPATLRGDDEPEKQFDTAHRNAYTGNRLGYGPNGDVRPNGLDFWWDDQGEGNCWQDNDPATGEVTHNAMDPRGLPTCDDGGSEGLPVNLIKSSPLAPCATYDRSSNPDPPVCDWLHTPDPPDDREQTVSSERHAGAGRVQTALAVSRAQFSSADAVVIARSDTYPDALAGAPLAAKVGGPILLTSSDGLLAEVAAEVARLGATRAYLLGGTAALSEAVEAGLSAAGVAEVFRLAGADRFATAVEVARLVGGPIGFVVKGFDADESRAWPDAVAASAAAAGLQRPVLLTGPDALPSATAAALDELGITDATVVGGEAAVSADVFAAVAERVERADRLGGVDRYATARLVAERAVLVYQQPDDVWLATGANWPDALVAGPAAAASGGVLLLVHPEDLETSAGAVEWLEEWAPYVERLHVLGGAAAVGDDVPGQALTVLGVNS